MGGSFSIILDLSGIELLILATSSTSSFILFTTVASIIVSISFSLVLFKILIFIKNIMATTMMKMPVTLMIGYIEGFIFAIDLLIISSCLFLSLYIGGNSHSKDKKF